MRGVCYGYYISGMSFQFEKYQNWSGIPRFLCSLIYCVISVWVSAVYAKYVSTPIHPVEFPQKNQFPNKPGFPLSTLIILVWYPYVSLFLDLLCYRFECQRFTQNTFQRLYTLRISTKNQFPNKSGFPLSTLIILDIYCVISVWVSAVYANYISTPIHPSNFHKKSVSKQTKIPVVHGNNFTLESPRFSVPWFIV